VFNCGTDQEESVDYPLFAKEVCRLVQTGKVDRGILICGTGNGVAMAANHWQGIRCVLAESCFLAQVGVKELNANIIAFGSRVLTVERTQLVLETYLNTCFDQQKFLSEKLKKINQLGKKW
jgi:ribose 5-phosphate isomerase B